MTLKLKIFFANLAFYRAELGFDKPFVDFRGLSTIKSGFGGIIIATSVKSLDKTSTAVYNV